MAVARLFKPLHTLKFVLRGAAWLLTASGLWTTRRKCGTIVEKIEKWMDFWLPTLAGWFMASPQLCEAYWYLHIAADQGIQKACACTWTTAHGYMFTQRAPGHLRPEARDPALEILQSMDANL